MAEHNLHLADGWDSWDGSQHVNSLNGQLGGLIGLSELHLEPLLLFKNLPGWLVEWKEYRVDTERTLPKIAGFLS